MKGLVIKQPWIEKILAGKKTWELRGSRTQHRGQFALIESGTGTIVGVAELVEVHGPLTRAELLRSGSKHRVPASQIRNGLSYKSTFAWEFSRCLPLAKPVPYTHPQGAVIWVNLAASVVRRVKLALA